MTNYSTIIVLFYRFPFLHCYFFKLLTRLLSTLTFNNCASLISTLFWWGLITPICLLKSSCFVVWELFVTNLDLAINFWIITKIAAIWWQITSQKWIYIWDLRNSSKVGKMKRFICKLKVSCRFIRSSSSKGHKGIVSQM